MRLGLSASLSASVSVPAPVVASTPTLPVSPRTVRVGWGPGPGGRVGGGGGGGGGLRAGGQVAHARSSLFHGRCDMLVMTERFHFYHRFRLRGVRHVLFYGPPLFPRHYPELVNLLALGAGAAVSVTAIYARQDLLALQRVVGTARAQRMLDSDKAVHLFA